MASKTSACDYFSLCIIIKLVCFRREVGKFEEPVISRQQLFWLNSRLNFRVRINPIFRFQSQLLFGDMAASLAKPINLASLSLSLNGF